jgi:CRISPR-associated protein Csm2
MQFKLKSARDSGKISSNDEIKPCKIPSNDEIKQFITQAEAIRSMITAAESFGKCIASDREKKITTSQIRNAYGTMKKLEMLGWNKQTERELWLLKPRLAYAAGRHGEGVKILKEVISTAIDCVNDADSFKRFCQFFEAIIAYHKAYGGKD